MPLVSVIIPTHRRPQLLGAAIRSVLDQTLQDFEIVVVDDASGDNTEQVVSSFGDPRIHYIAHRTNWRVGAARNTGVLNSRGQFIAFLDDDDEWYPEKLERQVAVLERSARVVGVVYTAFAMVERSSGRLVSTIRPQYRGHILNELCRQNCVGTASTPMIRRVCFDEAGLFDETIDFGEEYDMWIRVAHRFDFAFLAEPLVRYSVHGARLSMNYGTMIRGLERQIAKHERFFRTSRRTFSRRFVFLGSLYSYQGKTAKSLAAFARAIRNWPWAPKYYAYITLAALGAKTFTMLMRRYRRPR